MISENEDILQRMPKSWLVLRKIYLENKDEVKTDCFH